MSHPKSHQILNDMEDPKAKQANDQAVGLIAAAFALF